MLETAGKKIPFITILTLLAISMLHAGTIRAAGKPVAIIVKVKGDVKIQRQDKQKTVTKKQPLEQCDNLVVSDNATAIILFSNGTKKTYTSGVYRIEVDGYEAELAAIITDVQGNIEINNGCRIRTVTGKDVVRTGEQLIISEGGSATILYTDGTQTLLTQGKHIIEETSGEPPDENVIHDNTDNEMKAKTIALITFQTLPEELEENQWIGAGFSESVSTRIAAANFPSLQVYERRMLNSTLKLAGISQSQIQVGQDEVTRAATSLEQDGVDLLVLGSFQVAGYWNEPDTLFEFNGMVLETSENKVSQGRAISLSGQIGPGGQGLFEAHAVLTNKVLNALDIFPETAENPNAIKQIETDNLDAYRHYVMGLRAHDAGDFQVAIANFEKAEELNGAPFGQTSHSMVASYKRLYPGSPGKLESSPSDMHAATENNNSEGEAAGIR